LGFLGRVVRERLLSTARRTPLPATLRRRLGEALLWSPEPVLVPVDRLLLGGQNQVPAAEFASRSGDPQWPSRRVLDGPHADLLRRAEREPLTDDQILATPYAQMARDTIAIAGQYFAARDDTGIVTVARRWLDGVRSGDTPRHRMPHQSRPEDPVRVVPIRHSDCFQVLDGHHRVASLGVRGATVAPVRVKRIPVSTPLQDLLERMSWTGGTRELYQPVQSPELEAGWVPVRRCEDRLEKMEEMLASLDLAPGSSYLDVASCYGWFVDRFARLGFDAQGVERDENAPKIGALAYGLDPHRITVSDAETFLARADRTWEVVSCFSLLHHFVLGRAAVGADELLRLLDRVTGRVLFLDTGQAHEAWFADSLPEWDTDHVADFLTRHTSFDRVVDLGPDQDGVPPYERNYGRHLFAAVRDS
jgi:hypothetical protein